MVSIRPINNWERERKKKTTLRENVTKHSAKCASRARVSHLKDAMTTKMYNFNSIAGISRIWIRKSRMDISMYGKVREPREARDVFESSWIYCQRKQFAENFAKKEKKLSILSPKPRRDF